MLILGRIHPVLCSQSAEVVRGEGGVNVEHIIQGARVEYDAIGKRIHVRSFVDVGTPFPDNNRREYHDQFTLYYETVYYAHQM